VFLAATPWRHATNDLCAVLDALLGMKGALASCNALANDFAVFIDQYAHLVLFEIAVAAMGRSYDALSA